MRWTPSGIRRVREVRLLLPLPAQEPKEGNRDPLGEQKQGARQGAKAEPPFEEDGWGVARLVTKKGLIQTGASQPGIAMWLYMAFGLHSSRPLKLNLHPINESPLLRLSYFIVEPFIPAKDG